MTCRLWILLAIISSKQILKTSLLCFTIVVSCPRNLTHNWTLAAPNSNLRAQTSNFKPRSSTISPNPNKNIKFLLKTPFHFPPEKLSPLPIRRNPQHSPQKLHFISQEMLKNHNVGETSEEQISSKGNFLVVIIVIEKRNEFPQNGINIKTPPSNHRRSLYPETETEKTRSER
jgi:hypothetical protein